MTSKEVGAVQSVGLIWNDSDMLTSVLNQRVSLAVNSSSTICSDIEKSASYKVGAPTPKKPVPIGGIKSVSVTAREVLLRLGVAMLPPRHVRQHLATVQWGLVRYGYLIEAAATEGAPFATNSLVEDFHYHHMTALSEAFGVGCALSFAHHWLRSATGAHVHIPVDFDYLLGSEAPLPLPRAVASVQVQANPNTKRRPDYLIVAEQRNVGVRLLVVECKGTSGGRTTAIGQLGSAMHQLEGVIFGPSSAGSVAIPRHAYAACVSKITAAIDLYGVDPPENAQDTWLKPVLPARDEKPGLPGSDKEGRLLLPSPEMVSGHALRRVEDRTIAWAGAGDGVEDANIRHLRHEESNFGDLAGTTSSLRFPDGTTIEVFTGALVKALEASTDSDHERAQATREAIYSAVEGKGPELQSAPSVKLQGDSDSEHVASVINEDGLVLHIKMT